MRGETGGIPLAGGTDLLVKYRGPAETPAALPGAILSIGRVPELRVIEEAGGWLRVGSCVTLSELLAHPLVPAALKEAARQMAGPGIRNSATIGGNVCNASPAGDTLPFLYAVDAELRLASASGERVVPIRSFIAGPGRTILEAHELLTEIHVPLLDVRFYRYRKVGTRRANALSKISFLGLALRNGDVRIAFGACAPVTVRNREAEEFLRDSLRGGCHEIDQAVRLLYGPLLSPIDDQRSTSRYRKETALRVASAFVRELCLGGTE
jgi:CO/xanthine dehydrogenase FAD-binding subunit